MLPVDDGIDVCIAELDRWLAKGASAGFIPGFPVRPYHEPYYDPLYARAAEAGVPLTFHRTFGGKPSEADYDELVEQKITAAGTAYRFFAAVQPFTYMVMGGVFDRHPELQSSRPRSTAAGCRSGPRRWNRTSTFERVSTMQTREHCVVARPSGSDAISSSPCSTTRGLPAHGRLPVADRRVHVLHRLPHSVTLWPHSREIIPKLTGDLPPDATRKVLAGNAERLFGV